MLSLLLLVLALVLLIVVVVTAAIGRNLEPDAVILSTTLGYRHKHRLMVAGGGHRADTVEAFGETSSKIGAQKSVAIASVIDTLKEGKGLSIEGLGRVRVVAKILNRDMRVANNLPSLQGLRSSIVGVVGVGESAGLQIGDLNREGHRSVGRDHIAVLGASEDSRNHLVRRRDFSHGF